MYYVEKIFFGCIFWAFPFRSGYSGVPPSPFFHVAGSSLTRNVPERGGHAAFPSPSFRVAGSSLTCNVAERFGQHRSTLAFFHVAGSSLACNVTERRGQRCSLTIPNAWKRLPAPLPGHLSSARCRQTERNTCHPISRLHSVPLWYRASQVWLALPIGFLLLVKR